MNKQLKYNRARLAIIKMMAASGLKAGDSLPSQKQLTRLLPFGEITIRHALTSMQESGLISSRHGSGTYLVRDIRKEKFQNYVLVVSVYMPENLPQETNLSVLRVFLAERGIGLTVVAVMEFDQEVINAVTDDCIGILAEGWLTDEFISSLQTLGLPVVVLGNNDLSVKVPSVSIDMERTALEMTRMMVQEGLRKIVLFRGVRQYYLANQHETGYVKAMDEAGLEPMVVKAENHYSYHEAMAEFMPGHLDIEGVLAERNGIVDFIAWAWNHHFTRQPVLGFLSRLGLYHRFYQSARFFSYRSDSLNLCGGKKLLDYYADGTPIESEVIAPVIPPLNHNGDEFFVQ